MHGGLLELDIAKIEMGTAVVINTFWLILNNTTINIDISHPLSNFSCRLTYIYASRIVSVSSTRSHDNFTKVMGMVKKYKEDIGIIYTKQDLKCVLWCPRCQIYEHIPGPCFWRWCCCIHSIFHHANRLCDVIMEPDVSGRNSCRSIKISELARKICPQVSDICIWCTVVQNRPKVVRLK